MAEHGDSGGESGGDLKFFLIFFVLIFALWFITAGRGDNPIFKTGGSSSDTRDDRGESIGRGGSAEPLSRDDIQSEITDAYRELADLRDDVRTAKIWGERSAFENKVRLEVANANHEDGDQEFLRLHAESGNDSPIDISGWRFESYVTGNNAIIPWSARLAYAGRTNDVAPTLLYPGESAIVASGESPIGVSFHENVCTGYFEQYQDFFPSLGRSCPRPMDELKQSAVPLDDDRCYTYVDTLASCRIDRRAQSKNLSHSCETFIETTLTYKGCVANHRYDSGFERGDWRIYLAENNRNGLWREEREIIKLVDQIGKTVDVIEY